MDNSDDEAVPRLIVLAKGQLPHDPDGKLLRMGQDATCKTVTDMALSNSSVLKKKMFKQAMCIRLQEKQGWLAVRTDKFPAGDLEGAAKASLTIACYYCQLEELEKGRMWLEKGRKWLETTQKEAPEDKHVLCACIEHNMDLIEAIMAARDAEQSQRSASETPRQTGGGSPQQTGFNTALALDHTSLTRVLQDLAS